MMLWVELQPSQIHVLKGLPPIPQNMTLFGNRVFKDEFGKDKVILELGGPLLQYDCVFIKRGNLDTYV